MTVRRGLARGHLAQRSARAWGVMWRALVMVVFVAGMGLVRGERAAAQTGSASPKRHVLLLNSYHHGLSWTDNIVAAVRAEVLDPNRNPVADATELYVEYMDTKRIPLEGEREQQWFEMLSQKYATVPLDVIVVADNDAYNFFRRYADRLFPDTPVVFCGVNFFKDEDLMPAEGAESAGLDRFTGVVEQVDFRSTLEVALTLHPRTRHVVVVNDLTTTGQLVQAELEAVLPAFPDVTFDMMVDPTAEELGHLAELSGESLVLLVLLNRDGDGRFYTYEESIELLAGITDRPIYGVWDFYLGRGMVGGMLTNAELQGATAGEMVVHLLNGASVHSLPIVRESPNRYMFDYEVLERFGVSLRRLPDRASGMVASPGGDGEVVIVNAPTPFLVQHGMTIGGIAVVVVLAGGVVAMQRASLRRQGAVEAALRRSNEALEQARASMEAEVAGRTADLARRSTQLEIAAAVAREAASGALGLGVDALMERLASLIAERFGFYHVGVFLIDEVGEYAILRAASSDGGRRLVAQGHRLRIGSEQATGEGIVGYVAGRGESRIALNVRTDEAWRRTQALGRTQSEMALPLKARGMAGSGSAKGHADGIGDAATGEHGWRTALTREDVAVIGVLDLQSEESGAFKREDIEVLEVVADQLALAIQTARLFEESQQVIRRLERATAERLQAPWRRARTSRAYQFDGLQVRPAEDLADETNEPERGSRGSGQQAPTAEALVEETEAPERLVVPIPLRGQVVGTIVLERDPDAGAWLPEERALAETVGMQAGLSLESAQLLDESQIRAQRERLLGEITSRMHETLDMDLILQTALREMGESLGIANIEVRMRGGAHG